MIHALALAAVVAAAGAASPLSAGRVLTLDEAIRTARLANPSFAASREKLTQAEAWRRKALALFLPTWTATGTYTRWNKEVSFQAPDINSFYWDIAQTPPFGFKKYDTYVLQHENSWGASTSVNMYLLNLSNFPKYAAVDEQRRAAELSNLAFENEFIFGVVSAYYAALGAKKILVVSQEGVAVAQGHFAAAKGKFDAGEAPKLAYLRAEIELEKAQQDLRRAENGFAAAREALAVLMDGSADFDVADTADVPLPDGWDSGKPGAEAASALLDAAVKTRPDVAAAEVSVQAAEKSKQEVWYRFFPTLQLSGTLRYSDSLGFIGDDYQWFVLLSANMTLYDGGVRYADLKEKQSAITESALNLASARQQVRSQVRQAAVEIDTCASNRASAVRQVDLSQESYRVAKVNFDLGLSTSLEVTDANAALTAARVNLAREDLGCQLSRLKLLKVLGTIRRHYQ